MRLISILFAGLLSALALSACQSSSGASIQLSSSQAGAGPDLPASTSIVFQADLHGCRRAVLNLYRQTGPYDYEPADTLVLLRRAPKAGVDAYHAGGTPLETHVRAMVPGKYHIRTMSCGNKAPRDEFAIGSFDVVEGRMAYIGKLVVGKHKKRVLLRVNNEARAAHESVKLTHPDNQSRYGVRLLVSNIPTP